jgi:PAS domain S-box-containing protein/putative nucleotidyltransferase with HDIG domain
VIQSRRSLLTHTADDPAAQGALLVGTLKRSQATIRTPILTPAGVLGIISVQSYTPYRYTHEDVETLEAFASLAATALTNLRFLEDKQQTEKAVRQSEARFKSVVQNAYSMVTLLSRDGVIVYESPSCLHMLGYAPEELVGQNIFSLVHPDDVPVVLERFRRVVEHGETQTVELRFRHRNGDWRWIESTSINLLHDPSVEAIVSNARDITEKKEAEEAARQWEQHYALAVKAGNVSTWELDLTTGESLCSHSTTEFFSYPADIKHTHTLWESYLHPDDVLEQREVTRNILESKAERYSSSYRILHPQKGIRWVHAQGRVSYEADGTPLRMLGVNIDTTEQRRMHEALLEANERAIKDFDVLLARLDTLSQKVGVARDLTTIFRALLDFAAASTPADGLIVSRHDPQAQQRTCLYAAGFVQGVYEEDDVSTFPPRALSDSPQSRAIKTSDVVIIDSLQAALVNSPNANMGSDAEENPPLSSIAVPLNVLGETIGVFELQSTKPAAFTPEHVTALRMAANLVAIAVQNVTLLERERAARAAVEASEARFRSMVQNSSDLTALFDAGGTILHVSPAVSTILGYQPEQVTGQDLLAFAHPDDLPRVRHEFEQLVVTGTPRATLFRFRHASGAWRWLESIGSNQLQNPAVGAIVLNSRDVTGRKLAEDALRQSEANLQRLFDEAPAFMATTTGPEHTFSMANPIYLQIIGKQDIIGKTVREVLPQAEHQGLIKLLDHVYRTGETFYGSELPFMLDRNKDGMLHTAYFNLMYQAVRDLQGNPTGIIAHGVEVTEQVKARQALEQSAQEVQVLNQELEQRLKRLRAMHAIDLVIASNTDLHVMLRLFLEQITAELKVDAANVLLFRPESLTLEHGASKGFRTSALRRTHLRLGEGLAGKAALQRAPIYLAQDHDVAGHFPRTSSLGREGFVSYCAMPLISKGQLQGVLELFHRSPLGASDEWQDFLEAIAAQAAIAIDDARLFERLELSNLELTLAYDTTIEGWARALDLRDEETAGHSQRVTNLTVRLARQMGVPEEELVHVRRGALLHDIGKMGVPDAILLKPGKLTPEEWEVMKRHTTYANDLLSPIPFLKQALDIPYAHHEKFDGSGYPRGLQGTDIPLAARIFAIVDVYDALSSDRPYRKAWEQDKVIAYLQEQSGTHFDPAVVEAFLKLMNDRGLA